MPTQKHKKLSTSVVSRFPSALKYAFLATDIDQAADSVVSSWTDSIAGVSLAQGDALKQPLFRTDVNGSPAVDFDGVDDYLSTSDSALCGLFSSANGSTPDVTLFFVCSGRVSTGAAKWPFGFGNSATDNPIWSFNGTSTNDAVYLRSNTASNVNLGLSPASTSGKRVLTLQTKTALEYASFLNGTANQSGVAPNGGFSINRFAVGGLLRTSFTNPSTIKVHGILIADSALDAAGLASVMAFTSSEFGT